MTKCLADRKLHSRVCVCVYSSMQDQTNKRDITGKLIQLTHSRHDLPIYFTVA